MKQPIQDENLSESWWAPIGAFCLCMNWKSDKDELEAKKYMFKTEAECRQVFPKKCPACGDADLQVYVIEITALSDREREAIKAAKN